MLQHFGIARKNVLAIERLQEVGVEDDVFGIVEDTNLVFQSAVVDAGLAAYRSIHHGKQRGGYVDEVDTSFIGRGCKAAEIGNHATAEINHT